MGAEADLTGPPKRGQYAGASVQYITPLPLWTGILAGPIVWAFDLLVRYAVVKWSCITGHHWYFDALTVGSLAIVTFAAVVSWNALQQTSKDEPTDGGTPRQRARFMAILGLTISALFGLQIAAASIPNWILDACR